VCLAVPGKLINESGDTPLTRTGQVDFGGLSREVNLALVPDAVPGDYLLIHAGVAITVLSPEQSRRTLAELNLLDGGT
jgi:hydrogenase expression/formation protein HypC